MSANPILSLMVGVIIVLLGAILTYFVRMNSALVALRTDVTTLQTQISPLWARVQAQISADLHHPHPRYLEMDTLLERLEALTITVAERDRLKVLLRERSNDFHEDISSSQREKARLMIEVMDMVLLESKEKEK